MAQDILTVGGGGIVLVAGGNIATTAAGVDLRTSVSGGAAGNLVVVAGAAFTDNGNDVSVTGPSVTGGNIDFRTTAINTINARNATAGSSGGNVTMAAYRGSGGGTVQLPTALNLTTSGTATGTSGNVTMVGGNNTTAINIGAITTSGGTSGGQIDLRGAQPNAPVTITKDSGAYTAGAFLAVVQLRMERSRPTREFLQLPALMYLPRPTAQSLSGAVNTTASVNNTKGGNVTIRSLNRTADVSISSITANGLGSGAGGDVTIDSADIGLGATNANGGATGAGGNILITSVRNTPLDQFFGVFLTPKGNGGGNGGTIYY